MNGLLEKIGNLMCSIGWHKKSIYGSVRCYGYMFEHRHKCVRCGQDVIWRD